MNPHKCMVVCRHTEKTICYREIVIVHISTETIRQLFSGKLTETSFSLDDASLKSVANEAISMKVGSLKLIQWGGMRLKKLRRIW